MGSPDEDEGFLDSVRDLYPFFLGGAKHDTDAGKKQDGKRENAGPVNEALLEAVRQKVVHGVAIKRQFFVHNAQALVDAAHAIATVYQHGGRMLAMGNGSSSRDAENFAFEFMTPTTAGQRALPAVNLVADYAMLTDVGDDASSDHIFEHQVATHGHPEDGLIGFSTRDDSANLLRAFAAAKERGLITIGLIGNNDGKMAESEDIDYCLIVATDSINHIREIHTASCHILRDLVHTLLAQTPATSVHTS